MSSLDILGESAIETFAAVAFSNKHRLRKVWLISPWLSSGGSGEDVLSLILEASFVAKPQLTVLTRPPREDWHREAINTLSRAPRTLLFFHPDLHAKLYMLECEGFTYAMLGSPNLTRKAQRDNPELAIEFRTTYSSTSDKVARMIGQLIAYASALLADDATELVENQRPRR